MSNANASTADPKRYRATLNLPQTRFAMKANLIQNEPASLKRWTRQDVYNGLRRREHPQGPYVFHDGPPYANGSIHLGHLLNKVLKDFVVRSRSMAGYDCAFIPGWDCHGLPIEHKVATDLGPKIREMSPLAIRRKCRAYAEKFVKRQGQQISRLLTLMDLENPYLTMSPAYEAGVLEVFAELVSRGLVYRGLKPVHWSIENQTALAEAELEYEDREDISVFVRMDLTETTALTPQMNLPEGAAASLMIWTTTPWTIPANLAIAVHPDFEYGLYQWREGEKTIHVILADELAEKVLQAGSIEHAQRTGGCRGSELVGLCYQHPFIDRTSEVVRADYVTLEDGSGLVHTAPGHGVEDYQTGLREGLDVYCPVLADGTFDQSVPDWLVGQSVWQANDLVCERLAASGHLFHQQRFTHSYPHDWRSKTPVIFRATRQWFVHVDEPFHVVEGDQATSLRERALQVTAEEIRFVPAWGRNRMRGMLDSRPDWCLSRQRSWGLPIPVFHGPQPDQVLLTPASVRAVATVIANRGSDAWFELEPAALLESYRPDQDPDAPAWAAAALASGQLTSAGDIFDVWFESGSSWHACIRQRGLNRELGPVTDLYLEGSDQHRGWFQLSLLPALGVTGQPPFASVLTHGFMVDKDGRKMSKSLGNTIEVEDLLKELGADVCRWWVARLNTDNDIKVDWSFFKLAGEEYRKIRNTIRFLLSNLDDFDPAADSVTFGSEQAITLDAWILDELMELVDEVTGSYESFAFRRVHESLFHFCNETLSATYLTAVKDRLYCDAPSSERRRRTQTALHRIADGLIRLMAPILPHTADEAWAALHKQNPDELPSVHVALFPESLEVQEHEAWITVMGQRTAWLKCIENARQELGIDNPLDVGLQVPWSESLEILDPIDLADLCGISRLSLVRDLDAPVVKDLRDQPRCERSWKRDATVRARSDGGMLSDRDAAAVGVS